MHGFLMLLLGAVLGAIVVYTTWMEEDLDRIKHENTKLKKELALIKKDRDGGNV